MHRAGTRITTGYGEREQRGDHNDSKGACERTDMRDRAVKEWRRERVSEREREREGERARVSECVRESASEREREKEQNKLVLNRVSSPL